MNLKPYPKYKSSGVEWLGEVPEHWEIKRLKFLYKIKKRIAGTEGYNVLSVTQGGIKIKDIESNDGQLSMDYSKYQFVNIGDFVMNHMDLLTGYVDISNYFGVTSPDYRVFSIEDTINLFPKFNLYLLQMCYHLKIFFGFGQGVSTLGRWRLPSEQFNNFQYPLPPFTEQKIIADYLDRATSKIDALIEKKKRLADLLREKRTALISNAVTKGLDTTVNLKTSGVEWLGEVPEHWEINRIGFLASKIGSGKTPLGGAETYVNEGVCFIRSQNVYDEGLRLTDVVYISDETDEEMSCSKVFSGDILLNITGASLGRTCIVPENFVPANVNQHVCIIRIPNVKCRSYVSWVMKSSLVKHQIDAGQTGAAREGITFDQISKIVIPFPPKNEQKSIVVYMEQEIGKIDLLISKIETIIEKLTKYRTALISAAVTGKIDVRTININGVPPDESNH